MPTTIKCPMCKRALEVPDELMGKRVKCPGCKMIFTATPPGAAPPDDSSARRPRPGQKSEEAVRRKRPVPPPDDDDEDEDEDEEEQPRVRKKAAHRREEDYEDEEEEDYDEDEDEEEDEDEDEEEVRPRRRGRFRRHAAPHRGGTILTLGILSLVCLPIVFGPMAWIMGSKDLKEMKAGRMDRSGEGMTRAGYICGIIASALLILTALTWLILLAVSLVSIGMKGQ